MSEPYNQLDFAAEADAFAAATTFGKEDRALRNSMWMSAERMSGGSGVDMLHATKPKFNSRKGDHISDNGSSEQTFASKPSALLRNVYFEHDILIGVQPANGSTHTLSPSALQRAAAAQTSKWLSAHPSHGFVRVYASSGATGGGGGSFPSSRLVPCSTDTEAHAVCYMLGMPPNALHVQLNGGVVRRLDAYERPLEMQNGYLVKVGYRGVRRVQREGLTSDLAYLIKFYTGKPFDDSTYAHRGQVSSVLDVKFSGVLQRWSKRLCIISGTRLVVYKGKTKQTTAITMQLAKGTAEEVKLKGHILCLKLTSSVPERTVFLSFLDANQYFKWAKKLRKATTKSPQSADLSDCDLEFLPETIFSNDQLTVLNLRRNALRQRPMEEDIYTIGWLEDLSRFTCLQSLNLADNSLDVFPEAVCDIKTLVELNLASNRIAAVPPTIAQLSSLQAFHLHNNQLTSMPAEVTSLRHLSVLVLAFNKFHHVPAPVAALLDSRVSDCEVLIMAGNQVDALPGDTLAKLKNATKIDLRMNCLSLTPAETVRFGQLERMTHLDIRDNSVAELDLRCVRTLEYINCERNRMRSLKLCGLRLKTVFAAINELQQLSVSPKPEWLETIDVSRNHLDRLPTWLPNCFLLAVLKASYNRLTCLPDRLLSDTRRLKVIRVDHNKLQTLPQEIGWAAGSLEELQAHCNELESLPTDLLRKCNKLRVLNLSTNRLSHLPPLNKDLDLNRVHELYLTQNYLQDDCFDVVCGYTRLKILHLAFNELSHISERGVAMLEFLHEMNVSHNRLTSLPSSLVSLPQLKILRAHSNLLQTLPSFSESKSLMILDLTRNPLANIDIANLMLGSYQLQLHDLSIPASDSSNVVIGGDAQAVYGDNQKWMSPPNTGQGLVQGCDVGFIETSGNRNRYMFITTGAIIHMQ